MANINVSYSGDNPLLNVINDGNPNVRDSEGNTPLLIASKNGENLADSDKKDYTALHLAVLRKHIPVVSLWWKWWKWIR